MGNIIIGLHIGGWWQITALLFIWMLQFRMESLGTLCLMPKLEENLKSQVCPLPAFKWGLGGTIQLSLPHILYGAGFQEKYEQMTMFRVKVRDLTQVSVSVKMKKKIVELVKKEKAWESPLHGDISNNYNFSMEFIAP